MIAWLLSEIEKATIAREDAWERYVDSNRGSFIEQEADKEISYNMGKIDAYKEVLKYIEDAQRASVGE